MSLNKNSMLPTYQGNYSDMIGAIAAGDINSPCFMFLHDRNDLAFIHWEKDSEGNKKLVPHTILWEDMIDVQTKLSGLVDPEGKTISVVEYVQDTVAPVESKVETVTETVENIQKNGATILLTSDKIGGGE